MNSVNTKAAISSKDSEDSQQFLNVSAYKFISLDLLPLLQADLLEALRSCGVLGTILLADEGINIALAGTEPAVEQSISWFVRDERFSDITFKRSYSNLLPFSKLKVRIRHEIISFGQAGIDPERQPAPHISAGELKRWLDEGREFTLLDTRNRYEVESGTFERAVTLPIDNFKDFGEAVQKSTEIDRNKPVITFCTGGIRCEKAAPWMLANGFTDVQQIDGGILRYLEEFGAEHWSGDCFVFDDRVEVDPQLTETGAVLCKNCHRAVSLEGQESASFVEAVSCPRCVDDTGASAS